MIDSSFKFAGIAGAMALAISASVVAQDAEQWRIEDGGNGHWYRYVDRTTTDFTWSETRAEAMSMGGDLVTLETIDEWDFFCQVTNCGPEGVNSGPIGLVRSESDPNQWSWVSGVDLTYDRWRHPDEPNPNPSENRGIIIPSWPQSPYNAFATNSQRLLQEDYFIEWSADCNGDGIVDYGQILDGTFAMPMATACRIAVMRAKRASQDAVQWRIEDGGNGHWYRYVRPHHHRLHMVRNSCRSHVDGWRSRPPSRQSMSGISSAR